MNHQELERWAERAAKDLQHYADAATEAGGDVSLITECLLDEYDRIKQGIPSWQATILHD